MALIQLDEVVINARQWGSGDPVVLVHGLGMSTDLWVNQIPVLSSKYHVVAVDVRGFGRSDKPLSPGAYLIENLAGDIAALIRKLELPPVHYVGTSMAGYIGITLALSAPELCRSLALCHTACRSSIPPEVLQLRLDALEHQSMDEYGALVAQQALADPPDPLVREWLMDNVARNDKAAYTQVLREGLSGFDASERVASIELPTLVLVGDQDRVIPPDNGRRLASLLPTAELVEISGAGHLSYMEQADAFNAALLTFLAKH